MKPVSTRLYALLGILAFATYVWAILYFLPTPVPKEPTYEQGPHLASREIPTNEFDELITEIKNDIGLPNIKVVVRVGPYFQERNLIAAIILVYQPTYYIVLDEKFLKELSPEEKNATIAHEMGHILFGSGSNFDRRERATTEMLADIFAARYVDQKHVSSLLDKAYSGYMIRKQRLEILAQGQ